MGMKICNMDDPAMRQAISKRMLELRGQKRIEVCDYRPRRSDRQNRYYWPCFVQPFAAILLETGQCDNKDESADFAHEILKHKFLRREYIDPATGEAMPLAGSTAALDTAEFNEYLDRSAAWLAELGIEVPEPSIYREANEQQKEAA